MKKIFSYFLIFLLIITFSGCGIKNKYTPKASTFKMRPINEFYTQNTILITNNSLLKEDIEAGSSLGNPFIINLPKWTNVAIEITKRELKKRGSNIGNKSSLKELKLSIESVEITSYPFIARTILNLSIEASNGYIKTYKVNNSSPTALFERSSDGAIMIAVNKMLNDPKIISFIKE